MVKRFNYLYPKISQYNAGILFSFQDLKGGISHFSFSNSESKNVFPFSIRQYIINESACNVT